MGDVPTLTEVKAGADSWFNYNDDPDLASPQDQKRKVFPIVLAAHVKCIKVLERHAFPQSLLQLDGFVYSWAWWYHLYTILEDFGPLGDDGRKAAAFRLHLDIGLSVTVHVRVETRDAELARWAMERGSQKSVGAAVVETDSFAAFMQRAAVFLADVPEKHRHKALLDANVQFAGSPVSRQMYYAIQACLPLVVGTCAKSLDRLRREYGRDCFTKGYTKMYMMSRMCTKVSLTCKVGPLTLFEHCLHVLFVRIEVRVAAGRGHDGAEIAIHTRRLQW